jgi:hypothetical protein
MTDEEIIEDILDEFDFGRVQKAMELMEWTWGSPPEYPTLGELRKTARSLLKWLLPREGGGTATGGFYAEKRTIEGEPYYRLSFVLTSWDNHE